MRTFEPLVSRTWRFGSLYFGWEPPGVVSDCACWLIVHQCWMYGPYPTLRQCIHDVLCEWKHDRHLVG